MSTTATARLKRDVALTLEIIFFDRMYILQTKPYIQPVIPYIDKAKPFAVPVLALAVILATIPILAFMFFAVAITFPVTVLSLFFCALYIAC